MAKEILHRLEIAVLTWDPLSLNRLCKTTFLYPLPLGERCKHLMFSSAGQISGKKRIFVAKCGMVIRL